LHGRSRQQRYTKLADWDYISKVSLKSNEMAFFGNGDVLGYEDYYHHIENDHVDGVMIGRGALVYYIKKLLLLILLIKFVKLICDFIFSD